MKSHELVNGELVILMDKLMVRLKVLSVVSWGDGQEMIPRVWVTLEH